jgi:glycosyltransferase involved in cell wall biosynthesis
MKLFFDARYIRTDFHDGISRYSMELGGALAKLTDATFLISDPAQAAFLPSAAKTLVIHAPTSAKEPFTAFILNKYKPDVVYSPMQTIGSIGRRYKLILSLHDMIYYRHRLPPPSLGRHIRWGWWLFHASYTPQRLTLNGADIVATVSETSTRDFETVRLTKRPTIVIPNAPQRLVRYLNKPVALPKKAATNLVYMGSFMPYKNVETLLLGMEHLPGYTLHLLSRITPERKAEYKKMTPRGAKVIYHNGVSDGEYARLLADNALLVSASFDEGYGLPLAEALELGVPVIVSDLTIFHEVAGDGALYFPANDPFVYAEKVKQASSPDSYASLAALGKTHIAQYNWEQSAKTLLKAVNTLL